MIRILQLSPCLILLFLTIACDVPPAGPEAAASPSPGVTVPANTPAPLATAALPQSPSSSPPSLLRVWMPSEIGARTEAGSQEFASQIRAYEAAHGNLSVLVEQKPVEGPGGLLSYLQTGRDIAPSIMPDVVAVPTAVLADSRLRDLFYPLDSLLGSEFINDTYPAAAGQVTNDEQHYGYPFTTTGLTHLLYDTAAITETIPMNWTQFISDTNHTLVIPADSREGAMLGLQFYLAEGGRLADETGKAILEPEPLARALATVTTRKGNLLQSHQLKTLDEAWQYHQLGLSDFMWTRSEHLLERRALDPALIAQGYSAVPGVSVALMPLTSSWAWAITTRDPARQSLAADLISNLTTPEHLANWSSQSQVLPAQRSAMALLARQNPYYQFAGVESERARAMPISETSRLMDVLGDAVFQALTTEVSPQLIAEQAAAALSQ